jgi:hypothetical protein
MYEFIEGAIIEKTPTRVVLKDGGVGYLLLISVTTFSDLPNLGEVISLKTHFVVREDVQQLFGFSTDEEKSFPPSYFSLWHRTQVRTYSFVGNVNIRAKESHCDRINCDFD